MNIFQKIAERPKANRYSLKQQLHLNCMSMDLDQDGNEHESDIQRLPREGTITHLGMVRAKNEGEQQAEAESFKFKCEGEQLEHMSTDRSLQNDRKRQIHSKYVISKDNRIKRWFDLVMDFLIYYSVITALNLLGFAESNELVTDIDYFVWAMFALDLLLNFCTEYRNQHKQSIRNLGMIASHYANTRLLLDLAALLPFSWVGRPNTEYFLRLFRVLKMKRLYDKVDIYYIADFTASIFYRVESQAKKRMRLQIYYGWDLQKELAKMIFAAYAFACLWLYYVKLVIARENPERNFLVSFNLDQLTPRHQFFRTMYFIFSTLMTVGYGDYYATNQYEMGFAILLVITGPTWMAFTMGKAIGIINLIREISGITDKQELLNIWISNIEDNKAIMPRELREAILQHYIHYWKNDRLGSMYSLDQENEEYSLAVSDSFYKQLPNGIKNNLLLFIFDDVYYKFTFFFKEFHQIQNEIALCLQPRIYKEDSIILNSISKTNELFFKMSGNLTIGYYPREFYVVIATISDSFIVGDLFALEKSVSLFQFTASTKVQGFSIPANTVRTLIQLHKIDTKEYILQTSRIYKNYKSKIEEDKLRVIIETDARDETERLIDFDGKIAREANCKLDFVLNETSKISVKGIDIIKCSIDKMKHTRKKLLWDLKDKLVNLKT